MEIKTIYIANDGTEFEEEDECLQYESSLAAMCEFVQLYDRDFNPIVWNPENYDSMWNRLYYIVIKPHHEEEAEEWWQSSFGMMLNVNPFDDLDVEWRRWKRLDHGDEPTIIAFDFCDNNDWVILNNVYHKTKTITEGLNLMDALY